MPDTRMLIGLKPNIALSDLVGDIKTGTTNHINEKQMDAGKIFVAGRFWRIFLCTFTIGRRHRLYPESGKHHANKSFREEYLSLLEKFKVPHDERYIFKDVR